MYYWSYSIKKLAEIFIFFITICYSSSSYNLKDTTENKKIVEKLKPIKDYDFDIFFGLGLFQFFRIGTNIYISDNTSLLFSYSPAYGNATLQAVLGGGVPNEFTSYSAGVDYNYNGLIAGVEFIFKENFHPYYKNFILVTPKFSYRTNHDKKFYVSIGFSPYLGYYPDTQRLYRGGLNLWLDFGIRY